MPLSKSPRGQAVRPAQQRKLQKGVCILDKEHNSLYAFDAQYDVPALCGVDEAGRGPLCGPVSVAAVVLNVQNPIEGLNDSKKLSEKKRDALYDEIVQKALCYSVVLVSPQEIDRLNILGATMYGMKMAVEQLSVQPSLVLVDGNKTPDISLPCEAVVQGDGISASIAAASVLAKVTRDRYMVELSEKYPQYSLSKHKGYPTKLHYELLAQHGVQDFYRRSFLKKFFAKQGAQNNG